MKGLAMCRLTPLVPFVLVVVTGCVQARYSIAVDQNMPEGQLQTKHRYRVSNERISASCRKYQPGVFSEDGIPVNVYHHPGLVEKSDDGFWGFGAGFLYGASFMTLPKIEVEEWTDVCCVGVGDQMADSEAKVKKSGAGAITPTSWLVPLGDPDCSDSARLFSRNSKSFNKVNWDELSEVFDEARAYTYAATLVRMEREGKINNSVIQLAQEKQKRREMLLRAEKPLGDKDGIPVLVNQLTRNEAFTAGTIVLTVNGISQNRARQEAFARVKLAAEKEAKRTSLSQSVGEIRFTNETWDRNQMSAQFVVEWR